MMSFHSTNWSWFAFVRKVKVHPLFWFILGIGMMTGYFREVIMVFSIVMVHELGHALTATFFKWKLNKIELLPFGGVAEVENNGNQPFYQEFFIVIAGPIQHIWMIGLSFLLAGSTIWSMQAHELFVTHNLIILLFNLLPILPLDGGRLLQLFLLFNNPYKQAMLLSLRLSFFFLLIGMTVVIFLFPFHLNIWVVISFLLISHYLDWKQRHFRFMRFLMGRMEMRNHRSIKSLSIDGTITVKEVVHLFERNVTHRITYVDSRRGTMVISEEELLDYFLHYGGRIRMYDWVRRHVPFDRDNRTSEIVK
ncbi:site-2 protease family protein [Alkalihalobacillus pseudalcaliphilus]|uniref:site-2 protease family protein n=1 Tax=Alkalihalobacillus pseudalcaliphilus TaxID=79884 RepID=UPI002360355E|nr:site-2 protease family protein [Alkalihalobacillus pseudalcaliphilus]